MSFRNGTCRVMHRPGTGQTRTIRHTPIGDLKWQVSYRNQVIGEYEQSVNGWDTHLMSVIHYTVTFADGSTFNTKTTDRLVVGWDTPSVLTRMWWHHTDYKKMA